MDSAHESPECPNLVRSDAPARRDLVVLAVLAVLIVAGLIIAASAAVHH